MRGRNVKGYGAELLIIHNFLSKAFGRGACLILLAVCMMAVLSACGDGETETTAGFVEESQAPLPALELGEYKNLSAAYILPDITEEMIDRQIQQETDAFAEYEEADAQEVTEGSIVRADVEIWLNGSLVRTLEDQIFTVDSNGPEYAMELIGCRKGDIAVIGIKYSDSYESISLRGKELEYHISVDTLLNRQALELTDEWVQENTEYWQVGEYREAVRERLMTEQEEKADLKWKQEIQRMVEEGSTVNEYPEERLAYYQQLYRQYDEQYVQENGLVWEPYILEQYYCSTEEEYLAMILEEAYRAVKLETIMEEIAVREQIKISEKDREDFAKEQYERYGFSSVQEFQTYFSEEIIETGAKYTCVWNWIYNSCQKVS